jgi:hypothetical protein
MPIHLTHFVQIIKERGYDRNDFSLLPRPGRLWSPPYLLSYAYRGLKGRRNPEDIELIFYNRENLTYKSLTYTEWTLRSSENTFTEPFCRVCFLRGYRNDHILSSLRINGDLNKTGLKATRQNPFVVTENIYILLFWD